jgi:hypothetical protein
LCVPLACTHKDASPSQAKAAQPAATSRPDLPLAADELPPPQSFQANDKPGDDGSSIQVKWKRPANEDKDAKYVVEIAQSPEDFNKNNFKSKVVVTSPPESGDAYATDISPASDKFFPPPPLPKIDAEYLKQAVEKKLLTEDQHKRSLDALAKEDTVKKAQAELAAIESDLSDSQTAFDNVMVAMEKADPDTAHDPDLEKAQKALAKAADYMEYAQADLAGAITSEAKADLAQALAEIADMKTALSKAQTGLGSKLAAARPQIAATIELMSKVQDMLAKVKPISLTAGEESDLRWFERLKTDLKTRDQKARETEKAKINSQTWQVRLAVQRYGKNTYIAANERPVVLEASAKPHTFKRYKLNNLVFALIFCSIVSAFIAIAKRRPNLFIRKIAGLEAVDEAIGRSTEMDRPVFFVHGLGDVSGLATIASINILGRVAGRTAQNDSRIRVLNNDPIVTAVSQEVVQQAYSQAGRPDAYNADDVSLVASDQFSYVAAVSGLMVREQPGAIFLMGSFAAESLLLAETGASTGAIQVAGTDAYTQLPFFITTCDYTLIGEELYAASAYLSREPRLLGSLRGQDVGKAFLMIAIVVGSIALTVGAIWGYNLGWLRDLFKASSN